SGANRRAVIAIPFVDILNDLFAPLMLEIDIDVGRLAAFFRNETGKQKLGFVWIYLGNAKAVAHGAVGRRASALAKNVIVSRKFHHVMDGEEITRELYFVDERQLAGERCFDLFGNPVRKLVLGIAHPGALPGQILQMLLRRFARRYRLIGIFVLK